MGGGAVAQCGDCVVALCEAECGVKAGTAVPLGSIGVCPSLSLDQSFGLPSSKRRLEEEPGRLRDKDGMEELIWKDKKAEKKLKEKEKEKTIKWREYRKKREIRKEIKRGTIDIAGPKPSSITNIVLGTLVSMCGVL
jgi:hypothetical protein